MMTRQDAIRFVVAATLAVALLAAPVAAAAKVVDDYTKIKYPALPKFDVPEPEVYELPNGMKVFLMEDHELPLIDVNARIRTGSYYEPADETGLADLVGQVLREGGTTSMSGDEIDDFLAARAASIETGMGGDAGFASMNCLKEDFDDVLGVFADILRHPIFAEDRIEIAKGQAKAGIARRNDSIAGIAGREFNRLIYGPDSPLGRMTEYATLAEIDRQDLVDWYAKYYHPNDIYLGVSGDFDSAQMKKAIEAAFGDWKKGPDFAEPEPKINADVKPGVYFAEKGDVTQAYVRMGHQGIEMSNPDYFAVQVMNEVFGGGFSSRLFSRVRSNKGLAYSVGGGVGASFNRPGVFQVALSTKSGSMGESVDALMTEVRDIISDPPSDDELKRAKESILNSFIFNYTSPGRILGQQITYAYYGLPSNFLETYRDKIEQVSRQDVAEVAKKYIHPDKMALLVVGKAEDFDRPVSSFGDVTDLDITIPDPPDNAPELIRSADTLERGSELLTRAAKALNGGDGKPIRSAQTTMKLELSLAGQTMSVDQDVSMVLPDKVRVTLRMPMGEQVVVVNGDSGYMAMGPQRQAMPGDRVADTLSQLGRDLAVLAGNVDDPQLEAVAAGSDTVNGTPCDVVAVSYLGADSRLCVAGDGRVLRQTYQGTHPMQGKGRMDVYYSDYRDVGGRKLPFKREMRFEGKEFATATVQSIEVNPDIDASQFDVSGN